MKETEMGNISTEEFLNTIEYMILANPEMDGVEIEDTMGRVWFIRQINKVDAEIN